MARTKRKNLLKLDHHLNDGDPEREQDHQEQEQQEDHEQQAAEEEEEDEDRNVEVITQRVVILIPCLPESNSRQVENVAPVRKPIRHVPKFPKLQLLPKLLIHKHLQHLKQQQRNLFMKKKKPLLPFKKPPKPGKLLRASSYSMGARIPPGLKAFLFKRKLQSIGGLSLWLRSQGLGQFAKIFQEQDITSEAQLLNLTMQALKKLGVAPVGPRRKLIWAIDQLCKG